MLLVAESLRFAHFHTLHNLILCILLHGELLACRRILEAQSLRFAHFHTLHNFTLCTILLHGELLAGDEEHRDEKEKKPLPVAFLEDLDMRPLF